jgi:cytochrome c peroxidase
MKFLLAIAVLAIVFSCNATPPLPAASAAPPAAAGATSASPAVVESTNASGRARTINANGGPVVDKSSPFFTALGTNGRSCSTCHDASDAMTVTPEHLRARFDATGGTDPIFRTNDGSNSPVADVSTLDARRAAYSMLLGKGVIRVGIPIPAGAEFELAAVDDPYGFASAKELSMFRRPLPAANLRFLSTVMWDGRETFKDASQATGFAPLAADLADQANSATTGHAQSAALDDATRQAIVAFELQLYTAQAEDAAAGPLDADGATGGPAALSGQAFTFGVNDALSPGFDPSALTDFAAWKGSSDPSRAAIARGQELFDTRKVEITGVSGLNDDLGQPVIEGTCTTCHDTPHAGNHSVPMPLRIGLDDPHPAGHLDVSGLPVYTLRNTATGETQTTTDPGRALVTGKWKDVGRLKGPILRGLAGRAPYFHNGSDATLADAVRFYNERFQIQLTDDEQADLAAFLAAL